MLPISLNIAKELVLVVGRGRPGQQRYELAHASGAERITLHAIDQDGWACHAQALLKEYLPDESDFAGARVVFIAGLPLDVSQRLAAQARAAGALVNVEDVMELCDFHVPAIVRRGDLLVAVSTGGHVPGLAQRLKRFFEGVIGTEWEGRVRLLSEARARLRAEGVPKDEVVRQTVDRIEREQWLPRMVS